MAEKVPKNDDKLDVIQRRQRQRQWFQMTKKSGCRILNVCYIKICLPYAGPNTKRKLIPKKIVLCCRDTKCKNVTFITYSVLNFTREKKRRMSRKNIRIDIILNAFHIAIYFLFCFSVSSFNAWVGQFFFFLLCSKNRNR